MTTIPDSPPLSLDEARRIHTSNAAKWMLARVVEQQDGCWLYTPKGIVVKNVLDGGHVTTPRRAMQVVLGNQAFVEAHPYLGSTCGNPRCVAPAHVRPGNAPTRLVSRSPHRTSTLTAHRAAILTATLVRTVEELRIGGLDPLSLFAGTDVDGAGISR